MAFLKFLFLKFDSILDHATSISFKLSECLLDELRSDFSHFSIAARNQLPPSFQNNARYFRNIQIKPLPKDVVVKLRNIEDSKLFNMWYQFFDEKTTKSAGIPVQNLDFSSSMATCLKSKKTLISELCITYNWILKSELPSLLFNIKDTLKTLNVFALR